MRSPDISAALRLRKRQQQNHDRQDRRGRHGRGDKCLSVFDLRWHAGQDLRAVTCAKSFFVRAILRAVRVAIRRNTTEPQHG